MPINSDTATVAALSGGESDAEPDLQKSNFDQDKENETIRTMLEKSLLQVSDLKTQIGEIKRTQDLALDQQELQLDQAQEQLGVAQEAVKILEDCKQEYTSLEKRVLDGEIKTKTVLLEDLLAVESVCGDDKEQIALRRARILRIFQRQEALEESMEEIARLNVENANNKKNFDGFTETQESITIMYRKQLEAEIKRLTEQVEELQNNNEKKIVQIERTDQEINKEADLFNNKFVELQGVGEIDDKLNDDLKNWLDIHKAYHPQNKTLYDDIQELLTMKRGAVRIVCRFRSVENLFTVKTGKRLYPYVNLHKESFEVGDTALGDEKLALQFPKGNDEIKKQSTKKLGQNWWGVKLKKPDVLFFKSPNSKAAKYRKFERVFTGESQKKVYETLEPFVASALTGKTIGVFAYGASGAGKSYTMIGKEQEKNKSNPDADETMGIMPWVMKVFLQKLEQGHIHAMTYEVFEIYSEATNKNVKKVFDLLKLHRDGLRKTKNIVNKTLALNGKVQHNFPYYVAQESTVTPVKVWRGWQTLTGNDAQTTSWYHDTRTSSDNKIEDKWKTKSVLNHATLFENHQFDNTIDAEKQLETFLKNFHAITSLRKTDSNGFNAVSSRSHLVVRVNLTIEEGGQTNSAYFIDLAGREGGGDSGVVEAGRQINASLVSIAAAIRAKKDKICFDDQNNFAFQKKPSTVGCTNVNTTILPYLCRDLFLMHDSKLMVVLCLHPYVNEEDADGKWKFKDVVHDVYKSAHARTERVLLDATTGDR